MGKLYVQSQTRTPLARVRETLDQAQRALSNLNDNGRGALDVLHLFDQLEQELHELQQEGVDVRVEQTQFETLQRQLERHQGRLLKQAGPAFNKERESIEPARSHWWWYLDEAVAKQRRRKLLRVAVGAMTVSVLLIGAWLAYQQFLAPPPEVGQAFQRMEAAQASLAEGDLVAALEGFDAATELTPEDPEPWLWKGVLHDQLDEHAKAQAAFAAAETLYATRFDYVLNRGRIYVQAGDLEKAKADARAAIDLDPTSGWAHYLRAGIASHEGDFQAAVADLGRAAELARKNGNERLLTMATTQRAQLIQAGSLPTPE